MAESLTLDVADRPSIDRTDELHVTPDVGQPYRARVLDVDDDARTVAVRIPPNPAAPRPTNSQRRTFHADELEAWHVRGDLLINPPRLPRPVP